MARSGMSIIGAWRDRKKEAEEYYAASERALEMAKEAAAAGDDETAAVRLDEAKEYADMAKSAYKALNTEIKDGDKVLVIKNKALQTAMKGVEAAGRKGIEILKKEQEAARAVADELNDSVDGKLGEAHLKTVNGLTVEYHNTVKKVSQSWATQWELVEKNGKKVFKLLPGR
ncbi:hypothetical protein SAMN05660330_04075 [Desulforhopalus singaporensis]|uniref:Uncharacterized protein n=2 Tax=Desulforhopalus singaporensis TaxID=91360 RepID=A0A1H0VI55_9BACT|nr:hypothetical protein SAMN05660330_04075 [Desulforhopalus singaporensis]